MDLDCSNQNLQKIPQDAWRGKEAEYTRLLVNKNSLSSLPSSLMALENLQVLDASNNRIFQLPSCLSKLIKLQTLILQKNALSLLALPKLPNLTHLDLSYNRINTISDNSFASSKNLEILNLSNNSLRAFPSAAVDSLGSLKTLYLENNCLTTIPGSLLSLPTLIELNLQNNEILKLSCPLGSKPNQNIKLEGNSFVRSLLGAPKARISPPTTKRRASDQVPFKLATKAEIHEPKRTGSLPPKPLKPSTKRNIKTQQKYRNRRSNSFSGRSLSCSFKTGDLPIRVDLFDEDVMSVIPSKRFPSLPTPETKPIAHVIAAKEISALEKDVKKYKKRIANEQKAKQEAVEVLQTTLQKLNEISSDDYRITDIAKTIESSINILSRKRKEKSKGRISRRLSNSLIPRTPPPKKSPRSLSQLATSVSVGNMKRSTSQRKRKSDESLRNLETNVTGPVKPLSVMRRGKTEQVFSIENVGNDLDLAFTIEIVDGAKEKTLIGGDIISLFRYLIYHDRSTENLSSFLCMYRNFADRKIMINELSEAVKEWEKNKSEDLHSDATYQQICRIVQQWIEHYVRLDFWNDGSMLEKLLEVISHLPSIASTRLQKLLEFKLSECAEQEYRKPMKQQETTPINFQIIEFLSESPQELATQLTLLEFEMLQEIDPVQCISSASRKASVGIQRLIERFNIVSRWVATEIVMEPILKKRVGVMKFFIEIAECAFDIGNYNSVLEIVAGLTLSPALPRKANEVFQRLLKLMDGHHNFANYREVLQSAKLPCLPYFGIFLRDLTFVDDSLDNKLENGFANFHKMKRMSSIVQGIIHYQSCPFTFAIQRNLFNYLKNVAPLKEDTLYEKSTKCEPPSELWNL